jgi:hypothetical protein
MKTRSSAVGGVVNGLFVYIQENTSGRRKVFEAPREDYKSVKL